MTLSRRQFLISSLALAAAGSIAEADPLPSRGCKLVISGSFWWYDPVQSSEWGISGWRDELDKQRVIGFDVLWIANAQQALGTEKDAALFTGLMDLCARRKIEVILGIGTSGSWYSPLNLKNELAVCSANIGKIGERLKGHPAFRAWYIPHEIYMWWDAGDRYVQQLYPALVEACKKAANLPVTVSPFFILDRDKVFGDFPFNEPDEYSRYWAKLIKRGGFDIVMMQDSGEHFSYVTNDMRRPFFEAMRGACRAGGAKFWGNVEAAEFECPSKAEFIKRYGRVHHSAVKNPTWRPVPISRLKEKLELASEYCERIVSWGYQEFCRPALGETAARWYQEYRGYWRTVR